MLHRWERRGRLARALVPVLALGIAVVAVAEVAGGSQAGPSVGQLTTGASAVRGTDWELVWSDEFDGDRLDRGSWNVVVMPDPHNRELQYYTDRTDGQPGANAWVEDGVLIIEARAESYEHRDYTSARLNTKGLHEFRYGRFEARMQLPAEVGTWPAFWLLGANIDDVPWPACGEIDIMEGKGRLPTWTSVAIHSGPEPAQNRIVSSSYLLPRGDFQTEWHVFAAEWEEGEIRWYVDDEMIQRIQKPEADPPGYWPFDDGHPFFVLLNLAVGGRFDEDHPPPDDMEPQRLLVDWVRVYQR